MGTKAFPLVRGTKMRVTRLDNCGRPDYGDKGTVVSDGFVTIGVTANLNEGTAINVVNAGGNTCVSDPAKSELQNLTLAISFCQVNPDIYVITAGQEAVHDGNGDAVGFDINSDVSPSDIAFALEVWSEVPGEACSTDPNAQGAFGYLLWPFVTGGVPSDFTIENGAVTFGLSNAQTKKGTQWGVGPYEVVLDGVGSPSQLLVAKKTGVHMHVQYTELAPPDDTVGAVPLLDPADSAITDITLTPTGATVALAITPAADFENEPVEIFWGDGTDYDYVATTGATPDHTYTVDGTYTVTVRRGLSEFSKAVTVDVP